MVLCFVVKKVNERSYVCLYGRDKEGRIETIYIGHLEEIAKYYLAFKRDRRWRRGGDSNPRPPG